MQRISTSTSLTAAPSIVSPMQQVPTCDTIAAMIATPGSGPNGWTRSTRAPAMKTS